MRPSVEYKLLTPVSDKNGRPLVEKLKMFKPLVGEFLRARDAARNKSDETFTLCLIAECAGVALPLLYQMEIEDLQGASDALSRLAVPDDGDGGGEAKAGER